MKYKIPCPHFNHCSGCQLNTDVDKPPILLDAVDFFAEKGIADFTMKAGSATGWRYRAKLAVRGSIESPAIGLFKQGTHDVVDIPDCLIHHPNINRAVLFLKQFIQQEKIAPYNEKTGSGILRYVQIVVQRKTGKVQLTLVVNKESMGGLENSLSTLWTNGKELWHSVWINFNTRRDNIIFGREWRLFQGEEFLWETICQKEICFHPSSFAQANLDLFEEMVQNIKESVPRNPKIVEYYAGVGAIGLCLADEAFSIRCCEISPHAQECFNQSTQKLPVEQRQRLEFISGNVLDHLSLLDETDLVIVDPPRKGLESGLINQLMKLPIGIQLIYISCGWDSFKRNCDQLLEGWKLEKAQGYLFFPGTNSIETLALFTKK